MHKFKDELSFFYKKIEVPINMQDEYLNKLMINFFGYKCQIQRDPKHPEKFYELYVPILREKGNEKLIKREE